MAEYERALYWVIRERAGAGGWPPVNVTQVSGWTVTRLIAALFHKRVNEVARDIIDHHEHATNAD